MPPSSQSAFQSLSAFKPRDTQKTLDEAGTKYGIPERGQRVSSLRGLVGNLQSSVEAVDPSVTGRTSGSFTTEGQRQALVSKERAPILGDLSKQQGALGQEQAAYSEAQGLAGQLASTLLTEDKSTYQRLLDQYNTSLAAEQAAEEKRRYDAQLAEQNRRFEEETRQFNEQMRASRAGAGGYNVGGGTDIAGLLSGILGKDSGQKFIGGNDLRGRWAYEAKQGDKNAATALKYVGNDGKYSINFRNPPNNVQDWNAIKRALDAVGAVNIYAPPKAATKSSGFFSGVKAFGLK